jgi:hypothetical protein
LAAGVAIVAIINSRATSNDYIEYWSSAKLFLSGMNPYSSAEVLALEKAHGFLLDSPLIMLNPPWSLPLVAWLGFFSERVGLVLWILIAVGCLVTSISILQVPSRYRVIALIFAPVTGTLLMMQSSPFLLLGWSIFLRYHRTRPFVAGAALSLMAIKPHLFLLVWIVLLLESICKKDVIPLLGFASSLAASSAVVTLRIPTVWQDYWTLIHGSSLANNYFPTLPTLLRVSINVHWAWLALLPSAVATAWAVIYYLRNRLNWSWRHHGMLVMFLAIITSPYGWISDQVVLLPALNEAISSGPRRYSMEIITVLNSVAMVLICVRSKACMWLPLVWLLWYAYATSSKRLRDKSQTRLENGQEIAAAR